MSNELRNSVVVKNDNFVYSGDEMVKKTLELLGVEEQLANNPWVIEMFSRTIMKDIDLKCDYTEQQIVGIAEKINKSSKLSSKQRDEWFEENEKDSHDGTEYYGFAQVRNVRCLNGKSLLIQELFTYGESSESIMHVSLRVKKNEKNLNIHRRDYMGRIIDDKNIQNEEMCEVDENGIVISKDIVEWDENERSKWIRITRDKENPMIAKREIEDFGGNTKVEYYPINPIMMQDVVTQILVIQDAKPVGHAIFPTRQEAVEYWEEQNLCQQMAGRLKGRYEKGLRTMLEIANINIPEESR